ncbi:MAG: hypothetical protein LBL21_00870 [Rickettsiales bacterium]|nr:hypothetical protein [Rickettsiales bacterium]
MKKTPEALAKIAIGISIAAVAISIFAAVGRCGHRPPRGFRDGMPAQHEDFRRGKPGRHPGDIRKGSLTKAAEGTPQPKPEQKR